MTKEQKIQLYKEALACIEKNLHSSAGLCYLFYSISGINFYEEFSMIGKAGLFSKPENKNFTEITNQMIGKPYSEYWYPKGDFTERKQIIINAIKTLENDITK